MMRDITNLREVNKEDSFEFHCTCCGACCRHRNDILLSAYDMIRLLKYLKMTLSEFTEKYCHLYVGSDSKLPLVRIRPIGKNDICPFLYRGKCSVQQAKPTVCTLFPLARGFNPLTGEIQYYLQDVNCGTKNEMHRVEDWLREGFNEDAEECFALWSKMLLILGDFLRENQAACTDRVYNLIFAVLYDDYDYDRNYVEQFQERAEMINILVVNLKNLVNESSGHILSNA